MSIESEEYSPYCPICTACGEDGCCAATCCTMDPNGTYCQTYLKELHMGYLMYTDMYDIMNEHHKEELDEMWNKNYEKVWGRKVNRKELREEMDKLDKPQPDIRDYGYTE